MNIDRGDSMERERKVGENKTEKRENRVDKTYQSAYRNKQRARKREREREREKEKIEKTIY